MAVINVINYPVLLKGIFRIFESVLSSTHFKKLFSIKNLMV
jgi:hypothetical protein